MTRKNGNAATTTHYSNVLTYLCPENCRTTDCASEWLQTITSEQIKNQNVSNEWVAAMCSLGPRKLQSTNRHKLSTLNIIVSLQWNPWNPYRDQVVVSSPEPRPWTDPRERSWFQSWPEAPDPTFRFHGGATLVLNICESKHLKNRCSFLQLEWANINNMIFFSATNFAIAVESELCGPTCPNCSSRNTWSHPLPKC